MPRAHMTDNMGEASKTSGEESEDQEVTGAHAGAAQGRRSQWTEHRDPVKLLR